MRVKINGKDEETAAGTTVAQLIAGYGLEPRYVAVEVNCDLVPRRRYEETPLSEGDQIEIVTLVGGG